MSTKSEVKRGGPEQAMPKAGSVLSMWIMLRRSRAGSKCTRSSAESDSPV